MLFDLLGNFSLALYSVGSQVSYADSSKEFVLLYSWVGIPLPGLHIFFSHHPYLFAGGGGAFLLYTLS